MPLVTKSKIHELNKRDRDIIKEDLKDLHSQGETLDRVKEYAEAQWDLDVDTERLKSFLGLRGRKKTRMVS